MGVATGSGAAATVAVNSVSGAISGLTAAVTPLSTLILHNLGAELNATVRLDR